MSTDFVDWIKFQIADYSAVEMSRRGVFGDKGRCGTSHRGKTRGEDVRRRSRVCSDCLSSWSLWNVEARSTIVGVTLAHSVPCGIFIVVAARKAFMRRR